MTNDEKAKILDEIMYEYGHIAEYLSKAERPCGCDSSVGYVCEPCSELAILQRIASVYKLYYPRIKGN